MAMNQEKKHHEPSGQFEYLGRWVDKKHFRGFVYNEKEQKLANSHEEYEKLIASGVWFASKEDAMKAIPSEKEKESIKEIEKETKKVKKEVKVAKFSDLLEK